uniref:AMP-binding enzyme n=1 Tax=Candidatus Kentrum sp. FM TaxID=2126340 RepID=A0A450SUB6_9GAMM|nr:MAG: hypothetical protein BECKFM1743C_GA0114222_102026 [Candidatus Kentron sp. FM]
MPLDPEYPAEHLAFMSDDADLKVLLCHGATRERLPDCAVRILDLDAEAQAGCEPKCDFSQAPTGGRGDSEPKIPAPGCNRGHGSVGASPSRISLTFPKPYLGILVLGPDSNKSHFGSHPTQRCETEDVSREGVAFARRRRRLTLDELVAGALLRYSIYI